MIRARLDDAGRSGWSRNLPRPGTTDETELILGWPTDRVGLTESRSELTEAEVHHATVVANRYARALADVVASTGNYRQVLSELEDFGAAYRQSVELREVCETPAVAMAQKLSVLEALAGKMGSSHVTLNFLRVLMSHYRMPMLEEVIQAFRNVAYARLGIVRVKISSASDLSNRGAGTSAGAIQRADAEAVGIGIPS